MRAMSLAPWFLCRSPWLRLFFGCLCRPLQLLWEILDPEGLLIPREDWPARLTSTYPDTLTRAAPKTALTAVGCLSITQPQVRGLARGFEGDRWEG